MFSVLLLYLYNPCLLFTCGGNKEYYYALNTVIENEPVHKTMDAILIKYEKRKLSRAFSKPSKQALANL